MKLSVSTFAVREVERDRDDDVGEGFIVRVEPGALPQELFGRVGEHRQHYEEVSRHEGRQEGVLGAPDDLPVADGSHGRDEPGENPEGEEKRHQDVGQDEDLDTLELAQAHRSRHIGRDGEDSEGRQANDEAVDGGERPVEDREVVEQSLLLLDPDEGDPGRETEKNDGGDDVIGESVKRVRGDIQAQEVPAASGGWC